MRATAEQLLVRRVELGKICAEAVLRRRELSDLGQKVRQRREQVHQQRDRVRANVEKRVTALHIGDRAAAAILEAAVHAYGISWDDLWLDYYALGGSGSRDEMTAMVEGRRPIGSHDHDVVAIALNERLSSSGFCPLLACWDGSRWT